MEFIFIFDYLNFAFLSSKKREKVSKNIKLRYIEAIEIFMYRKNINIYLNNIKLYKQIRNEALFITKRV